MLSPIHEGGNSSIPPLTCKTELYLALIACAPAWALCGSTPQKAGCESSRRPIDYALKQRFCQLNPRKRLGVIVIDCDHHNGLNLLDAPPPTYTTMNPESGHQQPGYILAHPVSYGGAARRAPQQLLEDIRHGLTKELDGDPHFSGLISRGPMHPNHVTRIVSGRLWTLTDLLNSLPPLQTITRRQALCMAEHAEIEGRNCAAFEELRHVAYKLKAQGIEGQGLVRQLQERATLLNQSVFLNHPEGMLPERELRQVVIGICRWVDKNYIKPAQAGSARSRQHSRDRQALSEKEQLSRRRAGQLKAATVRRESTQSRLVAAENQLTEKGEPVTTVALMELAQVGRSTAARYLRNTSGG